MDDVNEVVELSDFIASLRRELVKAQQQGESENAPIRFGVEGIELEFELNIAKSLEGSADASAKAETDDQSLLRYFIGKMSGEVKIAGKGSFQTIAKQKVKLQLSAQDEDGNNPLLNSTEAQRRR